MKLNGSILVTVAMMFGALGAIGCNNSSSSDAAAQPEEVAKVEQPVADTASDKTETQATEKDSVNLRAKTTVRIGDDRPAPRYVPTAPPRARFENRGRAPSNRHFWVNGYHKYVHGRYIWVGGHWDTQRGNQIYVQPHYDRVDGKWRYVPGHWVRK